MSGYNAAQRYWGPRNKNWNPAYNTLYAYLLHGGFPGDLYNEARGITEGTKSSRAQTEASLRQSGQLDTPYGKALLSAIDASGRESVAASGDRIQQRRIDSLDLFNQMIVSPLSHNLPKKDQNPSKWRAALGALVQYFGGQDINAPDRNQRPPPEYQPSSVNYNERFTRSNPTAQRNDQQDYNWWANQNIYY
jgi:hypothetical protein